MAFNLISGKKWSYWRLDSQKDLRLLSKTDAWILGVVAVAFVVTFVITIYLTIANAGDFFSYAWIMAMPFFLAGMIWYFESKKIHIFLLIVGLGVAGAFFFGDAYRQTLFFIGFILIGAFGVVFIVSLLQRLLFYPVVGMVENMNVKDKYNLPETGVAFMFNIPRDMDTRSITMDYNTKRASIPWKEIRGTMALSFMFATFLWIYLSMNPTFFNIESYDNVPINLFTVILFIPILVMPWSIFRALNVRVETKFRSFYLYSGIVETMKKMMLPIFATFMFVLAAFNKNGVVPVLTFILLSIAMNFLVIGFTSLIYYRYFENHLVDEIVSKWRSYRPVELLMTIDESKEKEEECPATPKRDLSDYGELVFKD